MHAFSLEMLAHVCIYPVNVDMMQQNVSIYGFFADIYPVSNVDNPVSNVDNPISDVDNPISDAENPYFRRR